MKKLGLLTLAFSLCTSILAEPVCEKDHHGIVLTSEIISLIDGFPWGINANIIKHMLQVRREIKKIQFGDPTKDGKLVGHYIFDDIKYSVRTLATLESKYEMEYYKKLESYSKDKEGNHHPLVELQQWNNQIKHKFRTILEVAKKEFNIKVAPFSKNARGAKTQMLMLIEDSAKKRGREDCFLLKWADADEDNEMVAFNEQIITFKALDQFCTDLINFLEDLMRSCPKAWNQFKKIMDEQQDTHNDGHDHMDAKKIPQK